MSEKKVNAMYLLSEKGRKKSLLAGGDGKELQVIETEATPEIINISKVDKNGNILLKIGFTGNANNPSAVAIKASIGIHAFLNDKPYWASEKSIVCFDAPQTIKELIQWEQQRLQNTQYDALQPEYDRLVIEHEEKTALAAIERKKAEEKQKAEDEARKKANEVVETERLGWIEAHGSEHLRKATALGYNCQRKYVTERAAKELPDFMLDFDNYANWKGRNCPSKKALDSVQGLIKAGHNAIVVWLTDPIDSYDDEYGNEDPLFEPHEAIAITGFLGSYTLIRDN